MPTGPSFKIYYPCSLIRSWWPNQPWLHSIIICGWSTHCDWDNRQSWCQRYLGERSWNVMALDSPRPERWELSKAMLGETFPRYSCFLLTDSSKKAYGDAFGHVLLAYCARLQALPTQVRKVFVGGIPQDLEGQSVHIGNRLTSWLPVFQSSSVKVTHQFDMHNCITVIVLLLTHVCQMVPSHSKIPVASKHGIPYLSSLISTRLLGIRTARTCNRRNCFNSLVRWCDSSAGNERCGLCGFETAIWPAMLKCTSSARFRGPSQEGLGAVSISAFAAQEVTLLQILFARSAYQWLALRRYRDATKMKPTPTSHNHRGLGHQWVWDQV